MSLSASVIEAMAHAGATIEMIVAAVRAAEADDEAKRAEKRSKDAERQRNRRARLAVSRDVTLVTRDTPSPFLPSDKESSPTPPKENNSPLTPALDEPRERFANPAVVLQSVVDPLLAREFCDHCSQAGRRLTAQSARGVVGTLRQVEADGGDRSAALRFAMGQGWTAGFGVDWLRNKGFRFSKPKAEEIDWAGWVEGFYADGVWQDRLGPRPGETGCRAPSALLKEFASVGDRTSEEDAA